MKTRERETKHTQLTSVKVARLCPRGLFLGIVLPRYEVLTLLLAPSMFDDIVHDVGLEVEGKWLVRGEGAEWSNKMCEGCNVGE